MLIRGDRKHDISAYFSTNPARIYEIADGKLFPESTPTPADQLPPSGPYLSGRDSTSVMQVLQSVEKVLNEQLGQVRVLMENLGRRY